MGLLTRHFIKKTELEITAHRQEQKEKEEKKLFQTMVVLAQLGELTPERFDLMLSMLIHTQDSM